jgi:hypothetical protein
MKDSEAFVHNPLIKDELSKAGFTVVDANSL